MHDQRQVAAIVKNHVGSPVIRPENRLVDTPPELFFTFTLPGKGRDSGRSHGGSGMVLGREDVARRPADLSTEID